MSIKKLGDVKIPVEVVIGASELTLMELSVLGEGTIVKLDSFAGEPVQIRASEKIIGYGEIVVVDDNFGVRIMQLVQDEE